MRLAVNIDHIATLRNARGGTFPDPVVAALVALASLTAGIALSLQLNLPTGASIVLVNFLFFAIAFLFGNAVRGSGHDRKQ